MGTPFYAMDPNTGYPAGYPVPTQSPPNQMSFYPNQIPQQFPQSKAPSQPGQQQHSFGTMSMQPGVPGGATMPSAFPQQTTGRLTNPLFFSYSNLSPFFFLFLLLRFNFFPSRLS